MRHHPAYDVSRTYRSVFILLGRAALRADQHVHLLFPPVMRVQCANRTDSSTQHQRYHLLSAATLNNSRNRNFVHRKDHGRIEEGIECGQAARCWDSWQSPVSSWRAVAFSAGGDGGSVLLEHGGQRWRRTSSTTITPGRARQKPKLAARTGLLKL